MKALSVKEPWAIFIATGEKSVEVRTWKTDYRGRLLICASSRQDDSFEKLDAEGFPLGCAVCSAELTEIVPMTAALADAAFPCDDNAECRDEDFKGSYGWILKNPMICAPMFPIKGKLHLFEAEVPEDVKFIPSEEYFTE